MDPHKRPATIEVIDEQARVLAAGKYGTDRAGYAQMLAAARTFADRVWAVEGGNGIGRHLAHRLVHDGETEAATRLPGREILADLRVLPEPRCQVTPARRTPARSSHPPARPTGRTWPFHLP